ncbi:Rv3235 family protein [Gulosibacter faecalis]|uniref:Rv3235 family protein n=1 Tax=Gulosibacter faecalis TaxID=272240 RepID=UPI00037DF037
MTQPQRLTTTLTHDQPRKPRFGEGALTSRAEAAALELPNPEPLLLNLGRSVFEALAGVREVEQMVRWLAPEVYSKLLARVQHAARGRARNGTPVMRPQIDPIRCIWQSPRPGVVESTVLIDFGTRVRAVAIRLEGYRDRWRAERIHVL